MARLTPSRANNGRTCKNGDFHANLLARIDSRESKLFALANRAPTKGIFFAEVAWVGTQEKNRIFLSSLSEALTFLLACSVHFVGRHFGQFLWSSVEITRFVNR